MICACVTNSSIGTWEAPCFTNLEMNRLAFPACVPFIGQFSVLPPGSFDQGGEPLENTFTWNRCIPVYVLRSIRHEVQAPHRSLIRHPVRVATVAPPAAAPPDPGAPSSGLVRVRRSPGTARNPRQLDRWLQVHPPRRTPASSPARNAFASCPRPFLAAGLVLCRCVLPSAARDIPAAPHPSHHVTSVGRSSGPTG